MTTIVLVDDDKDLVEITAELLKLSKIDILGVGYDGKQAVDLCTKHNPDFLILDLSMPDFDGFYALEKLKGTKTKMIIITGSIGKENRTKLEPFHPFAVRTKPLKHDGLLKILNNT